METLDEIINEAIKRLDKQNDSQLAKAIGVTHVTIHNWRTRRSTPDNYAIVQLAKLLGRSPMEILGIIEAEKAKSEERKEYWQDFLAGLLDTTKKSGAIVALMFASYTTGIQKVEAAPAPPNNVYYVKRRIRKLLKALGFQKSVPQP